jgi:hypothetical protein
MIHEQDLSLDLDLDVFLGAGAQRTAGLPLEAPPLQNKV